jgi:predicted regulator of Ras-like GTPase activity (Roadblock/LC7/MglB family)
MDELRKPLEAICAGLPGVVTATIMGVDGLPVDSFVQEQASSSESAPDVESLLVEFTGLIAQVQRSAQMFAAGGLEELSIASEHLITIIRPINDEYFLAVAMLPHANTGKGRYLVRIHAPRLASALS